MLTSVKSQSPVLVMISSMSVLICSRYYIIRANSGKITSFRGYISNFKSKKRKKEKTKTKN